MCSFGGNWQYGSIDLDNGLVLSRQQAIIWGNVGVLCWCINALLNELNSAELTSIKYGAGIKIYIHIKLWHVITDTCHNSNLLKLIIIT